MTVTRTFSIQHAAELKAPLQSGSRLVFYTHTLCPYAQRVFLTLLYKEVPFDLVQVDLSDKPRWYRSINAQGLVPAVTYKGANYTESLDICRWLDTEFLQLSLTPTAPAAQQEMQQLKHHTSSIISAGLDLVAGSTARSWGVGTAPSRSQKQRFAAACQHMTDALQRTGGPYLTGPTPSLADVALLPFFNRFRLALQEFQGDDMGWLQGGAVLQWMANLEQQQWCALASPDSKLFTQALRKHASLDFFDYDTYDAYSCHPHLR
eukprot:GHUV01006845.1.p1 GENE.GHUV01006845.1~~GHUV01006845.1.p1  ORF type:complete len:263 (+),score=84.88 GHUV01006845.1:201-989(+)